jgi:GMP synthase-like glutamine amidotransferase
LVLQHEEGAPPALFARWCERRDVPYEIQRVWEYGLPPDPRVYPWICSLGSDHAPGAPTAPSWVDQEVEFLRVALDRDVPVLGLCFGGQALAAAAGAPIAPADPPEIGWIEIESERGEEIPVGPWLYFHYDQFALPAGAEELARSAAGTAAFKLGNSLGLQFHPEATPEIANTWVRVDEERLAPLGVTPSAVAIEGEASAEEAAAAAEMLFDRWWAGLQAS